MATTEADFVEEDFRTTGDDVEVDTTPRVIHQE